MDLRLLLLLLVVPSALGCGFLKKKDSASADAGAASGPATSGGAAADHAGKAKPLDATNCNPGTSIEPVDKGKTLQSDHFRYTLLDVRTDAIDNALSKVKKVYLVKLQIENTTNKPQLVTSVTDVDLTRDKPSADRIKDKDLHYKVDFIYPRPKMCVDLGGDVKPGMLPPGGKVVGYYVFGDPGTTPQSLWVDARNVSPESVSKGQFLKVVGTLRLK